MSGIFDALFTALGRPEGERGPLNPRTSQTTNHSQSTAAPPGQEGRRPGSQTAPSTPRVGKKVQSADQPKRTKTPQPASAMPSGTASRASEADASFTTLADVSTETASTQAEIHIGPQPLPYVYHRRSQSITHDLAPIGELRDRNQRYRRTSSAALTDIPSSVNPPKAIESAVVDVVDDSGLSAWRRDQLKHMKPAKLVNEGQVKTLASLHGPLSLPYARNPSGVDATAHDNAAHHGSMFGLRAVPRFNDTDRVVSNATNGTRSTSGSSLVYFPSKHKQASDSEHGQTSTVMVRDSSQGFDANNQGSHGDRARQHKSDYADHPMAMLASTRSALNPTSSPFTHKTLSRRALGVAALPTITDASNEVISSEQINPLVEAALAHILSEDGRFLAQYDDATIARLLSTAKFYGVDPRKVSNSSSTGSRIPSLETSSSMSSILSKMPQTPQHLPPGTSSKADVSANWRSKGKYGTPEHETPSKATATSTWSPPGPVMTIDELMAKFSSPASKGSDQGIKFKPPSPIDPVLKEKEPIGKPARSAKATASKTKVPLIEVSANLSPAASPRPADEKPEPKKSAAPKGTPGAGKLLKKQYVASPSPPPMPQLAKGSGKLVAIAERPSDTGSVEA